MSFIVEAYKDGKLTRKIVRVTLNKAIDDLRILDITGKYDLIKLIVIKLRK